VIRTRVGYSGGKKSNPTYHNLGNHTESFEVDFDPRVTSYEQIMQLFWQSHDPHSGVWSTQYKSVLFYRNAEQERLAREYAAQLEAEDGRPVTTEIRPFEKFWLAEDYHQKYYMKHRPELLTELEAYYGPDQQGITDSTLAARFNAYAKLTGRPDQLLSELDSYGVSPEGLQYLEAIAPRLSDHVAASCGI
jgi:methionine-S-sulfoxide reductase